LLKRTSVERVTPSRHNGWPTFEKKRKQLKGKGYAKGFIPCNAKATNDHIEKRSLAYLCNRFYQPRTKQFLEERGFDVHNDLFALSEMLQWLWRSQIRRGDPIHVFIPSSRMRRLLELWLDTNSTKELLQAIKAPPSPSDQSQRLNQSTRQWLVAAE
jgi:hypothetical protein